MSINGLIQCDVPVWQVHIVCDNCISFAHIWNIRYYCLDVFYVAWLFNLMKTVAWSHDRKSLELFQVLPWIPLLTLAPCDCCNVKQQSTENWFCKCCASEYQSFGNHFYLFTAPVPKRNTSNLKEVNKLFNTCNTVLERWMTMYAWLHWTKLWNTDMYNFVFAEFPTDNR